MINVLSFGGEFRTEKRNQYACTFGRSWKGMTAQEWVYSTTFSLAYLVMNA